MLQYPVQFSSLSTSSSSNNVYYKDDNDLRLNDPSRASPACPITKRLQKEPPVPRSTFSNFHSSHTVPIPISANSTPSPVPTPPLPSAKLPRSPYISSRRASSPVSCVHTRISSSNPPIVHSRRSSSSSTVEDVLLPGDIVGEGAVLQGETIRLVSIGPDASSQLIGVPQHHEPAKEFLVKKRLGHGSYAVVYLVQEVLFRPVPSEDGHMSTIGVMELEGKCSQSEPEYGREYAIKCLSKANLNEADLAAQMSEVTIHQSLGSHPNIVTLHRTLETSSFLLLIVEYVPGEDLFYFLEQARDHHESTTTAIPDSPSRTPPTPSLLSNLHPSQLLSRTRLRLISSMFAQMCDAVAACHDQQVFHRDIKPENFIVTDGWVTSPDGRQERKVVVKLTDFGLSTTDVVSSDMDCGSAPYMSFECRNNIAPTYRPRAADVWSLGIVLINMLYHYNPWTDTSPGVCSSFELYRRDPVNFFMLRFPGMTRQVAEFLANNVFCILDNPEDDSRRVGAREFGAWIRNLPIVLGGHSVHRSMSNNSTQGHPISSIPRSHRPCSRNPSSSASAIRTPALRTRSLSRAPSLEPAYEKQEISDLSAVLDQEQEVQETEVRERDKAYPEATTSTSATRRRKRGARRKGATSVTSSGPNDETLATLADASQSLAREISRASKSSSTTRSTSRKSSSTRRTAEPFEPLSIFPLPSALLTGPRNVTHNTAPASPPPTVVSRPRPVTKKPSIWKLPFGKNSNVVVSGRTSPTEDIPPSTSSDVGSSSMSTTATNVTNLIMSLDPLPQHQDSASSSNDSEGPWVRGRRPRGHYTAFNASSKSLSHKSSPSPESREARNLADRRGHRGTSPTSSHSGRPVASSASSVTSSNWRSSMSTTSSAGTSTSAFTRYSNSSVRSVSTAATSVSSASWRATVKPSQYPVPNRGSYAALPKNIKIMHGVPWELDQVPRGQHPDPDFGSPPVRKARTRKPKDVTLDTISERPGQAFVQKAPDSQRSEASISTTDLSRAAKDDGDGVKKVQKGQINALAKMLSALRR